jgi:hypothetical protein
VRRSEEEEELRVDKCVIVAPTDCQGREVNVAIFKSDCGRGRTPFRCWGKLGSRSQQSLVS